MVPSLTVRIASRGSSLAILVVYSQVAPALSAFVWHDKESRFFLLSEKGVGVCCHTPPNLHKRQATYVGRGGVGNRRVTSVFACSIFFSLSHRVTHTSKSSNPPSDVPAERQHATKFKSAQPWRGLERPVFLLAALNPCPPPALSRNYISEELATGIHNVVCIHRVYYYIRLSVLDNLSRPKLPLHIM